MNTDVKDISRITMNIIQKLNKYTPVIFTVFVLSLYSFLILHVSSLTQVEVDQTKVLEQLQTTTRGNQVDQRAVDRILLLQDQNVQVESLFEEARDNPFSE